MKTVHISASGSYDVLISRGLIDRCGELIGRLKAPCRAVVISDENVAPLYSDRVKSSLKKGGFRPESYVVGAGEGSKSMGALERLLEHLASAGITRSDLLVALGGGVVGDLTGFAASVYLRGVDFVQMPTTLLAAVDSSVGGKTAVNLSAGKNLAGSFYQPIGVICDCDAFATLPEGIYSDGMCEMIKYGVLTDEALFSALSSGRGFDEEEAAARCVEIKKRYVERDEFDRGERAFLNLGHTFGHAVERASGFSVPHGRAVGIGMATAARVSERLGLCERGTSERIRDALLACGEADRSRYAADELARYAAGDKKRAGDTMSFILPKRIGECFIHRVPASQIGELFSLGE